MRAQTIVLKYGIHNKELTRDKHTEADEDVSFLKTFGYYEIKRTALRNCLTVSVTHLHNLPIKVQEDLKRLEEITSGVVQR